MSYWISLNNPETNEMEEVQSFEEGGTYSIGGSNEADLNVTYNYADHFNFRELHEKTAEETINKMQVAVDLLGTERNPDYWESTKGNVGYTVNILLGWAKQFPKSIWRVN